MKHLPIQLHSKKIKSHYAAMPFMKIMKLKTPTKRGVAGISLDIAESAPDITA